MKEIIIRSKTRGTHTVIIDDSDYELVKKYTWWLHKVKGKPTMYAYATIKYRPSKHISMHRLIMGFPSGHIDHIDGNGLNNQKKNLREANFYQNNRNVRKRRDNTSGFKGVNPLPQGNYRARIRWNHKEIHIGVFDSPLMAAVAYNDAARKYHGEFCSVNIFTNEELKIISSYDR